MESVGNVVSGEGILEEHDRMVLVVYWELCGNYGVKCADVRYKVRFWMR